jgi:hypothetical protein
MLAGMEGSLIIESPMLVRVQCVHPRKCIQAFVVAGRLHCAAFVKRPLLTGKC